MRAFNKIGLFGFVAIFFSFCIASNSFSWGEVKKAKKFMQAGMYPQAIELLDKRIQNKPIDAQAHFQLGVCYINTGNLNKADERFASAVKLDSESDFKIGDEYKRVGDAALKNGKAGQAKVLYQKAIEYQPNLRGEIVQKYQNEKL